MADSGAFRKAPALRALLLYLWTNRELPVNEYRIATECLNKDSDFDPKVDATVRVHISRLRQKLKECGDIAGSAESPQIYRVTLPQGTYQVQVEEMAGAAEPVAEIGSKTRSFPFLLAAGIGVVLLVACGYLLIENRRLARQAESAKALPRFWEEFFRNGKPASVVLPTPVFYEWPDNGLKVRDIRINDFDRYRDSPMLQPLVGKFGRPQLMQNYTVVSDTFAAVKLAQYLQARGVTVSFSGTNDFSFDQFGDRNVILIGLSSTNFHIRQAMERTNYHALPEEASTIRNRAPASGESATHKMVLQSGSRRSVPGVVALLPGSSPNTKVLMIASWASSAMVSFLTSDPSLGQLDAAWGRAGSPENFEVLVQSEIDGNAVLRAGVVDLRRTRQ